MIPKPLQKLYDRAALFLDKQASVDDHYWAVGIHRALHEVYGGEIHTAPANIAKEKVAMSISRKGSARPVKSPCLHETFEEACARRRRITESFRKEHPQHRQPFLPPEEMAPELEAPQDVPPPTLPDEVQAA